MLGLLRSPDSPLDCPGERPKRVTWLGSVSDRTRARVQSPTFSEVIPAPTFSEVIPALSLVAVLGHTLLSGVMGLSRGQESGGLYA